MGEWDQEQIEQCMNYWENNCLFCLLFLLLVRLRVVGVMGSSSKRLKLPEKDDLWGKGTGTSVGDKGEKLGTE